MRILYVSPAYKPAYRMGGPIATVAATSEELVCKGHEVIVVTTNANLDTDVDVPLNRPVVVDGVTVWYFPRREPLRKFVPFIPYLAGSMGFAYAPSMKRALGNLIRDVDVVHTQMPFVYPTYVAARIAITTGKPLFYHQHGNFLPMRLRRRMLKKRLYIALFEKQLLARASGLIALTEAERDVFQTIAPTTPCYIVPNAVSVSTVTGASARVQARWGIPSDAQVILFLGRLETWKGVDELLATFARLHGSHPDLYLVMAGYDQCNAEARWFSKARSEGYGHRLIFTREVSGSEKEDLLERADLFSLPSRGEGLSMAMLEALAHGTAVMLSPECCFPEAERAGAGIVVERNLEKMIAALELLLGEPARMRAMGKAGRALVMQEYSWDVVADKLLDVYAKSLGHAGDHNRDSHTRP